MKNFKKNIALLSALALAGTMLAGCGSTDDTTADDSAETTAAAEGGDDASTDDAADDSADATASGDEEGVLSILAWNGNSDIVNMVDCFLESTGYDESKVQIVAVGDNGEGARDGYSQYLLGDGDADIMIMDSDWTQQYVNDDSLTAAYETIGLSKDDFTEAFSYTLSVGTSESGVFKAASFQATPGGFVYRADLAEQYLGVTSPEEMQEKVKDWDTFQATGVELYEASGRATSLQATEGGLWQVFQSNRTQPWVVDGALVMDTAEEFYDIAMAMQENHSLAGVPQWDAAWYAAVLDGTALGDFVPTWGLTTSEGSILYNFTDGSEENGANMAICEGPTGWYWGGSYLAVSTKCNDASLAKEFIEFFCKNADTMKTYAEKTGDFVNNTTVMSTLTTSNPLLNGQNHYEILTKVMANLDLEGKVTKYDSIIKSHFNDSVNGYLDGTYATKEDAINAFKDAVAASYPELIVE